MRRGLIAYVSMVAIAAAVVATLIVLSFPIELHGVRPWVGALALMALMVLGEGLGVRLSVGQAVFSISLIPTVASVALFGPAVAVVSRGVSQILAQAVILRRQTVKWVFNTAQLSLGIGLGSVVYVTLGGPYGYKSFELGAILPALGGLIVTYFFINMGLVGIVIALDTGKRLKDIWMQLGPTAFANELASSSYALFVVFAFVHLGPAGLLLVLLPLFTIHHAYSVQHKLVKQNREILEFTVRTIEAKDPYTSGHSVRVSSLSRELAEVIGLASNKVQEIETAALLHDIGKIDFAYSDLIGSPAQLTDLEREIIRSHPDRGARLLASLSNLSANILAGVRHHHEHYDGNGYPDGLVGHSIPLAARIIMVVDTVDAMLSNRPYRPAMSVEDVALELRRFSGRQFDPHLIGEFLKSGMLERAARRAEMDRTPLPLASVRSQARVSAPR